MSINKILTTENGANFYRCDLHIHTPCSLCYKDKSVKIEDIINKAKLENIDLIALSDHNDVGNIEKAIEIGKREGVVVLPGVEITSIGGKRGIHFLAIFDTSIKKEQILDLLTKIGLDTEKRGKEESITDCTIDELFSRIKKLNGICIAAHADSSQGIIDDLKGNQRINVVKNENLDCIELIDISNAKYFDGTDPNYKRQIPCIHCSDAHSIDEIGTRITRLKMDKPCLEGIRQAFLDPESRIKFDEDENLKPYPKLMGMHINGGFLDDLIIKFNPNLNCLIGGRGTGKSTTIELLRYVLDSLPDLEEYRKIRLDMVKNLLGRGEILLLLKTKDDDLLKIERKFDEEPRIYDVNNNELSIKATSLFPLVVFGETELEKISYDLMSQLSIIDNFSIGVGELLKEENNIIEYLKQNRETIKKEKILLAGFEGEFAEKVEVEAKLKMLEKYNFDDRLQKQKLIEKEKSFITGIDNILKIISERINIDDKCDYISKNYEKILNDLNLKELPNYKIIESIIYHFDRFIKYFEKRKKNDLDYINGINDSITKITLRLYKRHINQEKKTLDIFKELESEGIDEAGKTFLDLQAKRTRLNQVSLYIDESKKKIEDLYLKRNEKISELKYLREKIYNIRYSCVQKLSVQLGESINIEIKKNGNKNYYIKTLIRILRGSRVRGSVIEIITDKLDPFQFIELVQTNDKKKFMEKTDITEGWTELILGYQPLYENLLSLQEVKIPDLPILSLRVGGRYKPVNELSLGQKCTTLLSLAMIESDLPLIVDTPEQGLDNEFIYESVVKKLREIKEQRQIILATHNPNIPVSGDSELILCMNSDGKKGWIDSFGSIDESKIKIKVQEILEGGEEAFKRRQKKYGY